MSPKKIGLLLVMKKNLSIKTKISMLVLITVMCSTTIVGVFSYTLFRGSSIEVRADRAMAIAETVASAIDGDRFSAILASGEKDEYWHYITDFVNTVAERTSVTYLYLLDSNYGATVRYFTEADTPFLDEAFVLGEEEGIENHADELFETLRTGLSSSTGIYDSGDYGMMVSGFAAIKNSAGVVVGVVGADVMAEQVMDASRFFGIVIVSCVIGFGLLFWLISRLYIQRGISKPVVTIAEAADRFAKGDINSELSVHTNDEIGRLADSFLEMMDSTKKQIEILERLADGDLTAQVNLRSEHDSMSIAIKKTIAGLDEMLGGVRSTATQFSSASNHIAQNAQALAQDSTEQSATFDELSSHTTAITEKTKTTAEMAGQATLLATTIKENAEKGSHQMNEMMTAVNEINQASQSISKVIKVIDDIAFQTNILALNASVEAARAGQHGKGFAVVAEEVRNLAQKSADAAKDTGELIGNSMQKAEQGTRIAKDTAESFDEILSGIDKSSEIISMIAKSSEEQFTGIAQVSDGVNSASNVVEKTKHMAQEESVASEKLKEHAELLGELIAQFKLSEGSAETLSLPSGQHSGKK